MRKAIYIIGNDAKQVDTLLEFEADYIPVVTGKYIEHAGEAHSWISPTAVGAKHYVFFKSYIRVYQCKRWDFI